MGRKTVHGAVIILGGGLVGCKTGEFRSLGGSLHDEILRLEICCGMLMN